MAYSVLSSYITRLSQLHSLYIYIQAGSYFFAVKLVIILYRGFSDFLNRVIKYFEPNSKVIISTPRVHYTLAFSIINLLFLATFINNTM